MNHILTDYVVLISVVTWALAVSIKGGLLGRYLPFWDINENRLEAQLAEYSAKVVDAWKRKHTKEVGRLLKLIGKAFLTWSYDGSQVGRYLTFAWAMVYGNNWVDVVAVVFAFQFVLASMGEEAGTIGDYQGAYPNATYIVKGFKRGYGVKKALGYGVMVGAPLALATGSWLPWAAGLSFPLVYFVGMSARLYFTKGRDWSWSEPLWGGALGLGLGYALKGVAIVTPIILQQL